jgi:hypothetical protein
MVVGEQLRLRLGELRKTIGEDSGDPLVQLPPLCSEDRLIGAS